MASFLVRLKARHAEHFLYFPNVDPPDWNLFYFSDTAFFLVLEVGSCHTEYSMRLTKVCSFGGVETTLQSQLTLAITG